MDKEKQILQFIRLNPFITQKELANKIGISRSAVAGYIASLTRRGEIKGRAYILKDDYRITCIGGANVDRKARSKQKLAFHTSNPVSIAESCGGVARNIAENLGRLGCMTSLITCVGDDKEGNWILRETQKHGIDVSQSWVLHGERTGTYTALLDHEGEMVIALADMDIYEKITPKMMEEKWSHIASSQAVFLDTNISEECIRYMMKRCKEEKISLYIDPVSSVKAKKLPECLNGVDTILPNQEELETLVEMKIKTISDCEKACHILRQRGVHNVIVTLGKKGIFYSSPESSGHLSPLAVKVVDVTGAGDAFASGFLYGIIHKQSLLQSCQLGLAAAALTLQSEHSVSSDLHPDQLYALLEEK